MRAAPDAESVRLRTALREIVALFSLPSVWADRTPPAVVEGLADTLAGLPQIDFAHVRLCEPAGSAVVETTRGDAWAGFADWLERRSAEGERLLRREVVPDIDGDAGCRGLVIPIGVEGDGGLVAVAGAGSDFPNEVDLLLLSMSANHAATAFQTACFARDRADAEAELRQARDELALEQAALREIATLVAGESSPQDLFTAVAEQVARIVDVPLVRLLRFEPDGSAVELIGGWGESVDPLATGTRWPLEETVALASIWRSGEPARLDDYPRGQGQAAAVVQQAGMRSVVACPISVEGHLWGAIAVLSPRSEPLPEETEVRLAGFTELVAAAVANAEARRELERFAAEQEALRRAALLVADGASPAEVFAAITTSASELFEVPFASLLRYGTDGRATMVAGCAACSGFVGQTWTVPDDDPGIVRKVVASHRPARVDDHSGVHGPLGAAASSLGIGSVVGAPVIVDDTVWGVLAVGAAQVGPPLPMNAGERLIGFTELVTTTLTNAEAREKIRTLLDEQETLRRVATLVAQGAEPEAVFVSVCDEAVELFDAEQAAVARLEAPDATLVTVGLSAGIEGVTIGMRSELGAWPTTSTACRTGRTARSDVTAEEAAGTGTIADLVRAKGFLSSISAPIVVNGSVWGALTVSSSLRPLSADTERRIENFTELIATAIANREAREALTASEAHARRLASEQAALRRVATLAARESSAVEDLEAVAEEAARVLAVDAIGLIRFEPDATATLVAQSDTPWDPPPLGTSFTLDGENVVTVVHRTQSVARMDDWTNATGSVSALASVLGVTSAVASPIVVEGALWGTMVAATNREVPLPADTESRIVEFAELLATAVANAESREELTRLADEQAALRRVATLVAAGIEPEDVFTAVSDEVAQLFTADGSGVGRFEPDGSGVVAVGTRLSGNVKLGTRQDLDKSIIAGEVYRTGRVARIDLRHADLGDAEALGEMARQVLAMGFFSIVGAPIVVQGELWGLLTASSSHTSLPPDTERRVESFAELIATAIANASARTALAASEARARELANVQAALRRVATLVARAASPDELFSAVATEAAAIIDMPVVAVSRYEPDRTFTILGVAGETHFTVGRRWPVEEEGIAGIILSTGRPSRWDDYSTLPGRLGETVRGELLGSTVGVPIVVEGRIWGFMVAAAESGTPVPADAETQLARFTELVATAVSNASTRTELLTSRARLVSTADETRRRLERDLHDGIQAWLVTLALRARKASRLPPADESLLRELSGLADDLVEVTEELREISRGIHPAILSEAGLDDALAALARRSAIPVDLETSFQARYDPTLEATVYYVVAEAITNAVKHAHASRVAVRGGARPGSIELEIADDGVGGAEPQRGTGLLGVKDRIDTLGGTISLASPAGAGTTIRVQLPVSSGVSEPSAFRGSEEPASAPLSG